MNSTVLRELGLATLLELHGHVALLTVQSDVLVGNALADPTRRIQAVYLPPGYDEHAATRYPVLYYLCGYGSDVRTTIAPRTWDPNLLQRCDRMIVEKKMKPAIIVVVDAWTRLGGSQFVNSVHNGDYASYITSEVIAAVDSTFRTRANPSGRGVFGHSSGGFGALHLAMRYPGIFGAVASHAGDSYFRYATMPAFEKTRRELARHATLSDFATDFFSREKRSGDLFEAMMTLAYAAAYSPRSSHVFEIDLPFSLETGELREEIFARWLSFDPVEQVQDQRAATALREMSLCYLDCGRNDEWSLDVGSRIFAQRARSLGVNVVHEEFDGGHSDMKHRFERSVPLMLEALSQ